jgi:hypothetical protein
MRHSLFAVMTALILTGCPWEMEPVHFDRKTFDRERAAWEAAGITDYEVVESFSSSSFGTNREARITVENNIIVQRENLDEWELAHPETIGDDGPVAFQYVKTVSEIYAWIAWRVEEFLAGADGTWRLWIDISYDTTRHYPVKARVFVTCAEWDVTLGGDFSMELSAFTPLPVEGE